MPSLPLRDATSTRSDTDLVFDVIPVARALAEARAHLGDSGTSHDVLVTDVGLPDGRGWELVSDARQCPSAMHLGVVAGWRATVHGGVSAADFIMRKPLRPAELLASLARLGALPDSGPTQ